MQPNSSKLPTLSQAYHIPVSITLTDYHPVFPPVNYIRLRRLNTLLTTTGIICHVGILWTALSTSFVCETPTQTRNGPPPCWITAAGHLWRSQPWIIEQCFQWQVVKSVLVLCPDLIWKVRGQWNTWCRFRTRPPEVTLVTNGLYFRARHDSPCLLADI